MLELVILNGNDSYHASKPDVYIYATIAYHVMFLAAVAFSQRQISILWHNSPEINEELLAAPL